MRGNASAQLFVQGVVQAIMETFDEGDWMSLGLATGHLARVRDHGRLLRSFKFGDPDYREHVIAVVAEILEFDDQDHVEWLQNVDAIERATSLRSFLETSDPDMFRKLYVPGDSGAVEGVATVAEVMGLTDVDRYVTRIRQGLEHDPAVAIGSAKELLETVLKSILGLTGNGKETLQDLPVLMGQATEKLGLNPGGVRAAEPGAQQRRKLLQALSTIVITATELRNRGFGTGHGGVGRPELDIPTAHLVVSSVATLARFLLEAEHAHQAVSPW